MIETILPWLGGVMRQQQTQSVALTSIVARRAGMLLAALGLAACGGAAESPRGVSAQEVVVRAEITSAHFRFEPGRIAVRAQAPVRLRFDNRLIAGNSGGALEHDFTIDRAAPGWLPLLLGPTVQLRVKANTQATAEFRLPRGTYTYYCSVYQHREDGMVGTLIVE